MSDFNYSGNITYFNASYDDAFISIDDNNFYCPSSNTIKKMAEFTNGDWYEYQPTESMKFYYDGAERTINQYSKVRILANKTQKYGVFFFLKGASGTNRDVYLNLINLENGNPLHWCPCVKSGFSDYNIIGAVSTTPNTHVFILGYDYRFILFFSSLYTRQSDQQDYQIVCSDFKRGIYYSNGDFITSYFASMGGEFTEEYLTYHYPKPIISSDGSIPFKALMVNGLIGNNESYVSVGDVLNSIQDTNKKTGKITHNSVDYIKYATNDVNSLTVWFRIYGGSNEL